MTVTVTGSLEGDHVSLNAINTSGTAEKFTIERLGDDGYQAVPNGYEVEGSPTANEVTLDDWDLPQNTPLLYRAWAYVNAAWQVSEPYSVDGTLDRSGDWLYDVAHPEEGMVIFIQDIGDFERKNSAEVVEVLGRKYPVAASWGRKAETTVMTLLTLNDIARQHLLTIFSGATLGLAVRYPATFGMPGIFYFVARDVVEERPSRLGAEPARRWRVPAVRVERPVIVGATSAGANLWSMQTPNPGETETWAEWSAARETWDEVSG